jgi:hypothetical protein
VSSNCRNADGGFALVGTIIFLVSVGLMISGVFLLGIFELRQGRSAILVEQAFRSSEQGAAVIVGSLTNGVATADTGSYSGGTASGRWEGMVVPSGLSHSLIRSVGYSPGGFARQEVGMLLEHRLADLGGTTAALNVLGVFTRGPGLLATGFDGGSGAPACLNPEEGTGLNVVSLVLRDSVACAGCFEGAPPVGVDSSLGDSTAISSFNRLSFQANKTIRGGTFSMVGPTYLPAGGCDVGNMANWGSFGGVGGSCESYSPVVYSKDDLKVVGGGGQGVILVEGDLELTGGFEFTGVVIVKGDLTIGDSGAKVFGSMTADGVNFPQNPASKGPFVIFSSCAVTRVLEAHLVPRPLDQRSWVPLY